MLDLPVQCRTLSSAYHFSLLLTTVRQAPRTLGSISAAALHAPVTQQTPAYRYYDPMAANPSASTTQHPSLSVITAAGPQSVPVLLNVGPRFALPIGAIPERASPLLDVANAINASTPASSAAKINSAVRLWCETLRWLNVAPPNITAAVPVALLIARCCPPAGLDLPPFLSRRVLPTTAAADLDTLRRAATMGVHGMEGSLAALADHSVLSLQRAIGGRARRLTTSKRPLLFHKVETFWSQSERDHDLACRTGNSLEAYRIARDGFAVVLAFAAATRVSELTSLMGRHLQIDDDNVLIVTFASVKNRRTLFSSHEPFKIALRLPLLLRAFDLFNTCCGFSDDMYVFHRMSGSTRDKLSRDWFSAVVKAIDPGCSPHSVRVGAATELHAAGVPITGIMALGRWTSAAAVIYIVGCLDVTIDASARLGSAKLTFVRGDLRKRVDVPPAISPWIVDHRNATRVDEWIDHCAAIDDND